MSNNNRQFPASMKRESVNSDPLLDAGNKSFQSPGAASITSSSNSGKRPKEVYSELSAQYRPVSPSDPIELQTDAFLKECKTNPISIHDVPHNFHGLKKLADAHAWHDVVGLSGKLLFEEESTSDQDLSSITCIRFQGLFRMKMYDDLNTEVTNIINGEEKPQDAVTSTPKNYNLYMAMRLLLNEIKIVTGRSQKALDNLCALRVWLAAEKKQTTMTYFWTWHVRCHIANAHVRLRNWKLAARELQQMLRDIAALQATVATHSAAADAILETKIVVLCRLACVLHQIGVVKKSASCVELASKLFSSHSNVKTNASLQAQVLLAEGLQSFCVDKFGEAMEKFLCVVDLQSVESAAAASAREQSASSFFETSSSLAALDVMEELSALSADDLATATSRAVSLVLSSPEDGSLLAAAVNNCAICALYEKKISEAIRHLEQLIKRNPSLFMIDPVVFNLCTLYDLSFAPDVSTLMKKVLQRIAGKFHVDDPVLHWRSFRLT